MIVTTGWILSLSFGLLFGLAVGIGIAFKAVRLADINISCLPFLRYWNMFSLSMFVICLVSGAAVSSRVFHQKE